MLTARRFRFFVIFAAAWASWTLPACTKTSRVQDAALTATTNGRARSDFIAEGKEAMVASAHPAASAAGLSILRAGGNAADAAAAVSFAISVVRPQSTGIGGGGFLLYHDAKNARQECWDFRERGPAAATRDMFLDQHGKPRSFTYAGHTLPDASVNGHL